TTSPQVYASRRVLEIQSDNTTIGGLIQTSTLNSENKSFVFVDNNRAGFGTPNDLPVVFLNNGSEKMRITTDGKVGIGHSNPARFLHIADDVPVIRLSDADGS